MDVHHIILNKITDFLNDYKLYDLIVNNYCILFGSFIRKVIIGSNIKKLDIIVFTKYKDKFLSELCQKKYNIQFNIIFMDIEGFKKQLPIDPNFEVDILGFYNNIIFNWTNYDLTIDNIYIRIMSKNTIQFHSNVQQDLIDDIKSDGYFVTKILEKFH